MRFCEKISKILENNELGISSIKQLEDYLDVGRSAIGAHCSKKADPNSQPGLKTRKIIYEKLRINKIWWDTGNGEIYLTTAEEKPVMHVAKEPDGSTDYKSFKHQIFHGDYVGLHKQAWALFEDAMRNDKDLLKDLAATIKNLTKTVGNQR